MEGTTLSVADNAGPLDVSRVLFRLESPTGPREAGDGLDSPDGLKAKSRKKNEEAWLGRIIPFG
jgi:hypothetical protein